MTHLSEHLRQATPVVVERGEGVHLFGTDGRRYLDFTAGIGVTSTGHCHPKVVAAASMTTSGAKVRTGFGPLMGGVVVTPFPHAFYYGWDEETATRFALREFDQLLQTVSDPDDTAAIFVEPVLGEGG